MRLRAFSSMGELRLFGNAFPISHPAFDSRKDFLGLKVSNEDLSDLAVAFISRVGADASEELIAKCRELVAFADEHRREHETVGQYYERLQRDYGSENERG